MAARRVTRRSIALALLFGSVAVWQLLPSSASRRPSPETALPDARTGLAPQAGADSVAEEVAEPWRQLQTASCPVGYGCCPATQVAQEIDLFLSSTGHLTTQNCRSGNFCIESGKEWMLMLYIFGILYMFVALAIVCEEFFVPSLECFVEDFNISMDVAGATFMAAGGSMPELFTSFIGTFKESDIGMAAIVGSAVFNVLFVIATCAVASTEVLVLTWWPLARDCSFYIVTLTTLAIFFKGTSASEVEPWEAAILLVEYVGYCAFMKFNERIHGWVLSKISKPKIHAAQEGGGDAAGTSMWPAVPQDKVAPEEGFVDRNHSHPDGAHSQTSHLDPMFKKPSTFRQSIVALMVQNETITDTAGMAAVTRLAGDLRETFDRLDKDQSGHIDAAEFRTLLKELGLKTDSDSIDTAIRTLTRLSDDGQICFETFKKWFVASEVRIEIKMCKVFDRFDHNRNGTIEREEVKEVLQSLGHHPTDEEINKAIEEMMSSGAPGAASEEVQVSEVSQPEDDSCVVVGSKAGKQGVVTFAQFSQWYKTSLYWHDKQKQVHNEEHAAESYFTLDKPECGTLSAWVWYVLTYPICASMYVTMPDVRKPGCEHVRMALVEFLLSLVWIAFFSLCLVEWTEITSNTIGIPVPVAGLTVLAAGTSIPDLLSSYIVAKQGQGDMAVSSSIGSNIFDVTVGLPLPWLIYSISRGKAVRVKTESLGVSVIVLTLMIAAVIITIMVMRWRMTKCLGYIMFLLYAVFLVQALLMQMPEGDPLFPPPF